MPPVFQFQHWEIGSITLESVCGDAPRKGQLLRMYGKKELPTLFQSSGILSVVGWTCKNQRRSVTALLKPSALRRYQTRR